MVAAGIAMKGGSSVGIRAMFHVKQRNTRLPVRPKPNSGVCRGRVTAFQLSYYALCRQANNRRA